MAGGPLLVFSPHLDDAVLSLGHLIAAHPGSIVVTVLAGMPPDETLTTEWDTTCGFDNAGDSMRGRWAEDTAALSTLSATSIHLDFLDRQYGNADRRSVAAEIERIIAEHPGHAVYGPLGLVHPDHILVSNAFLDAVSSNEPYEGALYADIPYYAMAGSLGRRLAELEQRKVVIGELVHAVEAIDAEKTGADLPPAKVRARGLYASQMRALDNVPLDLPELTAAVRCTSRR